MNRILATYLAELNRSRREVSLPIRERPNDGERVDEPKRYPERENL